MAQGRIRLDVNYYELLELDPSVDAGTQSGREDIDDLIKTQKSRWSEEASLFPGWRRAQARVRLAALPQLENDLASNLAVWQLHRDQVARSRVATQTRRAAAAAQCLAVLGGPRVPEDAVRSLEKMLGPNVVKDAAAKLGVTVDGSAQRSESAFEVDEHFEDVVAARQELGDVLAQLNLESIYELLSQDAEESFSAATPSREIEAALERQRKHFNVRTNRHARILFAEALNKLRGILKDGAEQKRKLFDQLEPFNRVHHLERLVDAMPSRISAAQFERLVKAAQAATRLDEAVVEHHFRQLCSLRKVEIVATESAPSVAVLICAYCGGINEASAAECSACSRSLWESCFNCRERRLASIPSCPKCGLSDADATFAASAAIRGESMARAGDVAGAEVQLQTIVELAPQAAKPLRESIEAARKDAASALAKIDRLLADGRVHTARSRLDALTADRTASDARRRRADAAIQEAAERTAAARRALRGGDTDTALAELRAALSLAVDDRAARSVLADIPPQPPTGLEIQVRKDGVALHWKPAKGDPSVVTHRVVRTFDHPPAKPKDGDVIESGVENSVVDVTCPSGRQVYYGVFAIRDDVASERCATLGPTMLLPPVANLEVRQVGLSLHFTWAKPRGAQGVVVTRSVRTSRGSTAPTRVAVAQSQWTDSAPPDDTTAVYTFAAQFNVPGLGVIDADAISIEAARTPEPSLPRIGPPTGDRRSLVWSPAVSAGEVDVVLAYRARPAIEPEEVVALDSLPVPLHSFPAGGATRMEPAIFGEHWFVVARQRGELVRCSAPSKRAFARPIEDATIEETPAGVVLRWTWPVGCDTANVTTRIDDGAPISERVSRDGSAATAAKSLPVNIAAEVHVLIAATAPESGVTSETVEIRHRVLAANTLYYSVKRSRGRWRPGRGHPKVELEIRLERAEPMPAFQIRFDDTLPDRDEGEVVLTFPGGSSAVAELVLDIGAELAGRTGFLGVHLLTPEDRARIEVMPYAPEVR